MGNFLDFQQIKADNPIEQVVEKLGLDMKKAGQQLRGPCPRCKAGGPRTLAVTPSKGAYYCFTDKRGGDAIELVAHINDMSVKEAAGFLAGSVPEERDKKKGTKSEASEAKGFKPLDYLEPDHEAVAAVGFDPEDAKRLGVGYAPRGVLRGQVAIPVRLSDGTLVGYIGVQEAVLPGSWHF